MSEKLKPALKTVEREADAPVLLDQIVELMERRDNARANKPQPIEIRTMAELREWAEMAARSGMVPKDYIGKPDAILIAVDLGAELGFKRMQALQGIAVINGRPSVWGDALWALVVSQPSLENTREWIEGEGDNMTAYCEIKRRGRDAIVGKFSVAEAKKAGLFGKNIWAAYPSRMLQMRARAFAARDAYADALKGLQMAEEVMDYQADEKPAPPVRMETPEPPAPRTKPPSEKTLQARDSAINQLTACEAPEEWIALDDKSRKWRATLATAHPEIAAEVEAAFEEARNRLFPEADGDREPGSEG
jgi:hypothetical protein